MLYDQARLDTLWTHLARADENGAPSGCTGLTEVPFEILPDWFRMEYARRVAGWWTPAEGDIIAPFGDLGIVLAHLSDERTHIKRHHLSCAAIDIPGAENSALSIWYRLAEGNRIWAALPGATYRTG